MMRAPSPFLQKPYGKWGARAQKRGFACAEILKFTQISPNETAAICRDFKETTMFGRRPRHCFLLLRRIFRASPVDKCAEFILFLFAARAAQWEKAKSVVFAFSKNFSLTFSFELTKEKAEKASLPFLFSRAKRRNGESQATAILPQFSSFPYYNRKAEN